ncbi:hypothetical protein PUN4_1000010 [Paraburkholderia unamae]|nr:hypothetical protein PUN4_1000010 [Paraburkholderia unamae]
MINKVYETYLLKRVFTPLAQNYCPHASVTKDNTRDSPECYACRPFPPGWDPMNLPLAIRKPRVCCLAPTGRMAPAHEIHAAGIHTQGGMAAS